MARISLLLSRAIKLAGNWIRNIGQLLLLLLELLGGGGSGVLLEPLGGLLNGVEDSLLVLLIDLAIGLSVSSTRCSHQKELWLTLPIPHHR